MNDQNSDSTQISDTPASSDIHQEQFAPQVNSLRELIDLVNGRRFDDSMPHAESGFAEVQPFPFLALVGQMEMKLALILSLINPVISGVLLVGPRGTGKTTAVRSLTNLLPQILRSACYYGCMPEDIETSGIDAVCPDCAKKYGEGRSLTTTDLVHLIELPLNTRIEDVIGGVDERAVAHERFRLKRGILARADKNILYVDEINLLPDEIVDSILDAAAQNYYTVRRGPVSATYKSQFTLIGSMNPEEGLLRPQIMDRFGLRVIVHGLTESELRLEAYRRVKAYRRNPLAVINQYSYETNQAREEIQTARKTLDQVQIPDEVANAGIQLIRNFQIDSLRSEITMFEAARAYAAADRRTLVRLEDLQIVAPLSLRMRRSEFMQKYFELQEKEEEELKKIIEEVLPQKGSQI